MFLYSYESLVNVMSVFYRGEARMKKISQHAFLVPIEKLYLYQKA